MDVLSLLKSVPNYTVIEVKDATPELEGIDLLPADGTRYVLEALWTFCMTPHVEDNAY